MKERKYKEDYVLEEYIDERGKEKRRSVYRGKWYAMEEKALRALRVRAWTTVIVFAAAFFAYMELGTPSTYCMYVLPVACCAIVPLLYWVMGCASLLRAPLKMTRVQRETTVGRVLRSSVGCAALTGMACIGDVIFMFVSLKELASQEVWGFTLLLCAAVSAVGCFRTARDAFNDMKETSAPGEGENA